MDKDTIINQLERVIYTIDGVRTDNRDGNWDRLMGCRQVLIEIRENLMAEKEGADVVQSE